MFNSTFATAQFITTTQLSHGLDAWQSWSDRNFAQAQEIILGVIALFAYSAGVIAAGAYWLTVWAAEVMLATNIYANARYQRIAQGFGIVRSGFVSWVQYVESVLQAKRLDGYAPFMQAILAVNTAAQLQRSELGYLAAAYV